MLAYLVNRFYNPLIKGMFRDKYNIRLNEDRFALSEDVYKRQGLPLCVGRS